MIDAIFSRRNLHFDTICAFSGRVPFAFLEDIHGRFVKAYGRAALTALAYAMNDEFSRVLAQQMDYYSNDASADRINRMKGEIDQVYTVFLLRHDVIIIVIRKKNETKLNFKFGSLYFKTSVSLRACLVSTC